MSDYRDINRANWDDRAAVHAQSPDYDFDSFVDNPAHLSGVVTNDSPLLGDISGLKGVHLQCHIGTDTISLARLGAQMTGLDFSPASLEHARALAARANVDITFVEAELYEAATVLEAGSFDLVYTGIGAICWLPDIERWASTVAGLLRPGGRLFIREGHPILLAINEERRDGLHIDYSYFERPEPLVFDSTDTYVETDVAIASSVTHEWNHGIGEIITGLLNAGMTLTGFVEHTTVPWEALPGQMVPAENGEWELATEKWRIPLAFTLQAVKT